MSRQNHRAEAAAMEPMIHVGKSGIDRVVGELRKQLKIKTMVKVKFLRTAILEKDKRELAEQLADQTNSELLEVRGNTAVFRRKG